MATIKITVDVERRIQRIESEEFMIKLNGLPNQHYRDVLAPLGIELVFLGINPMPEPKKGH